MNGGGFGGDSSSSLSVLVDMVDNYLLFVCWCFGNQNAFMGFQVLLN